MSRTVISFSLYGNVEKYFRGLIENCKQINEVYPSFWIYLFIGNDFDHRILDGKLNNFSNIEVFQTNKSGHENRSHRFFAIDFPEVGIMFSRDLDSIVNLRDQYCINEFLKSDKKFQIIRDQPVHNTYILAGMWGIKKGLLQTKVRDLFNNFKTQRVFGITKQIQIVVESDQHFLAKVMYPLIKHDALVFDEYFKYPNEQPQKILVDTIYFPPNNSYDFVGNPIFNWDDYFKMIKK